MMRIIVGLFLLCLLGCADNRAQQTLEAEYSARSTQIADLRLTATVQVARLQTTVDYVETRVANAAAQGRFIRSTLVKYGTPQEDLDNFMQDASDGTIILPTVTPSPANVIRSTTAPVIGSNDTPYLPETATPMPEVGARLEQMVTSTGVGDDDCATGITATFDSPIAEIYVVATAKETPAETTFSSRWFYENDEIAFFDWTPDFAIDEGCIWFFIDETDVTFAPGVWQVEMAINGVPALAPQQFIINAADET